MKNCTPEKLRELRQIAGMTQHQVSRASGVHASQVSLFESGFIELTDKQKTAVCKVLLQAVRTRAAVIGKILHDQKLVLADVAGG